MKPATSNDVNVRRGAAAVTIRWATGEETSLPHLWLRDNCACGECRIEQTSEKRFIISSVPADIAPDDVAVAGGELRLTWPDGHETSYAFEALRTAGGRLAPNWSPWPDNFVPQRVDYRQFLDDDAVAATAITEFIDRGAIILSHAPTERGTLETLAPRLGPIREVLFDRIHDVEVDPAGYNVAHTPLPLPPHNDFASYSWPPSVQALHMLVNDARGGSSVIVDGFAVLSALREEAPALFDVLCAMPVPFREFDDDTETYAVAPIVRCDVDGRIASLRFSNQLMQTIDPGDSRAAAFYDAYHELCRRLTGDDARATFRLDGGEILIVAAHRVLHGREAFEPTGRRHLQDAYFELDNVINHLYVLRHRET